MKKEKCAQSGVCLAVSDCGASSTGPGAQNVDVGPGDREQLPQSEANAVASGTLFHSSFAGCTFQDKAPGELVENMMRYRGSYELEHGFKRSSSRMCHGGPGVEVFFRDTPSRCATSAWMLREMFQDRWVDRRLAAQSFRTYRLPPDAPELRGNLYGSFALQYAAGAQALTDVVFVVVGNGVP